MSFGKEYKTDNELLEVISGNLEELVELLMETNSMIIEWDGAGDNESPADEIEKHVNDISGAFRKFGKSLKKAPALFVLDRLMSLLEPLMLILEPINVLFEILGGLLTVFAGEIMKSLFDALQPVFDVLISLTPVFKVIGQLVGMLLKVALIPLSVIFEIIGAILKPFLPLIERLSPIFEIIGTVLSWLIRIGLLPLVGAIYAVGLGIAALINFFSFGLVDAVSGWNGLMLPILSSMVTPLAEGGIVNGQGIFMLGDNRSGKEAVVPLEKAGSMGFGGNDDLLNDINENLMIQNQLIRKQSKGLQRGRFGR